MRVYQSSHQILGNKANIANISPNVKLFSLLKSSVGYLQDSEVFKNTVHHVFFRQMFEFVDKVDHVLAHRRAVDPVNALSSLQASVLRLQHGHTQSIKWETVRQLFGRRVQDQCRFLPLLSQQPACQTSRLWLTQWWSCSRGCCTGCWRRRKSQGHPACRCCSGPPVEGIRRIRLGMIVTYLDAFGVLCGCVASEHERTWD